MAVLIRNEGGRADLSSVAELIRVALFSDTHYEGHDRVFICTGAATKEEDFSGAQR